MKALRRSKLILTALTGPECLEGDDGQRVLDARNDLHLLVDEMADIGVVVDIELDQEIIVPGGGVDLGGDLGFGDRVGDRVGLAELAFDLDEERYHRGRDSGMSWVQIGRFWGR